MKPTSFATKAFVAAIVFAASTSLTFANDTKAQPSATDQPAANDQPSAKDHSSANDESIVKDRSIVKDKPIFKDKVPCPPPLVLKDGFYVGAQIGYDSYRDRHNINSPGASGIIGTTALSATGVEAGLLVGYGTTINKWFYVGGELFANTSNAGINYSTSDALGTYTARFKAHDTWGLALFPGVKITDSTLGYLRFGWNWANLKASESVTGSPSTSKGNTSNGFNSGLGMETLLKGNWSLRTEYSHTWYNSFNTGYGTSINPSDNQYNLGLIYHFA